MHSNNLINVSDSANLKVISLLSVALNKVESAARGASSKIYKFVDQYREAIIASMYSSDLVDVTSIFNSDAKISSELDFRKTYLHNDNVYCIMASPLSDESDRYKGVILYFPVSLLTGNLSSPSLDLVEGMQIDTFNDLCYDDFMTYINDNLITL